MKAKKRNAVYYYCICFFGKLKDPEGAGKRQKEAAEKKAKEKEAAEKAEKEKEAAERTEEEDEAAKNSEKGTQATTDKAAKTASAVVNVVPDVGKTAAAKADTLKKEEVNVSGENKASTNQGNQLEQDPNVRPETGGATGTEGKTQGTPEKGNFYVGEEVEVQGSVKLFIAEEFVRNDYQAGALKNFHLRDLADLELGKEDSVWITMLLDSRFYYGQSGSVGNFKRFIVYQPQTAPFLGHPQIHQNCFRSTIYPDALRGVAGDFPGMAHKDAKNWFQVGANVVKYGLQVGQAGIGDQLHQFLEGESVDEAKVKVPSLHQLGFKGDETNWWWQVTDDVRFRMSMLTLERDRQVTQIQNIKTELTKMKNIKTGLSKFGQQRTDQGAGVAAPMIREQGIQEAPLLEDDSDDTEAPTSEEQMPEIETNGSKVFGHFVQTMHKTFPGLSKIFEAREKRKPRIIAEEAGNSQISAQPQQPAVLGEARGTTDGPKGSSMPLVEQNAPTSGGLVEDKQRIAAYERNRKRKQARTSIG